MAKVTQQQIDAQTAAQTVASAASTAATAVASAAASANAAMSTDIGYIKRDLGEIKQSVKELSGAFPTKSEFVEVVRVQEDHEKRTRTIEQNMWKQIGVSSILSALGMALFGYLLKFL